MGNVITFYSYKGGVGRTMALANTAVLLSQWGYKVLIIDWDLEAPGLEFYFKDFLDLEKISQQKGVLDLLYNEFEQEPKSTELVKWEDFCLEVHVPNSSIPIHFLTAGQRDSNYFNRVRELDLETFYTQGGGYAIEELRNEWKKIYDFVLIDSRTGITDMGGICTVQMPDILVLLYIANEQNLRGIINVAQKANLARQDLPFDRFTLLSLPIPSRFYSGEEFQASQEWLNRFEKDLPPIYDYWLPRSVNKRKFLEITKLPYVAYFSFGEKLPVLEQGTTDPQGLGYAYETLTSLIADKLKSVEQLMNDRDQYVLSKNLNRSNLEQIYKNNIYANNRFTYGNGFIYGRPVKAVEFYDRKRETRRIIGRLAQGQSTAIIGQPRTGKTSLLNVVMDEVFQSVVLGKPLEQTILHFIDSHMFGQVFTQYEFWELVLNPLSIQIQDGNVQNLYAIAKENQFGIFTLETLFRGLQDVSWKVVLLMDEFDAILNHPVLNSTEFYGGLRSLTSRFSSLTLVIASRRSLDDLNVETQMLNPHGSPYFNTFTEQHIGSLPQKYAEEILDQAGADFSRADHDFVLEVSGRHPHLLQLTAALLWEYEPETDYEETDEAAWMRHETVANQVYDQADTHFKDTWRTWTNAERKVITAIALAQIPSLVEGHEFKWQALIQDIEDFSPELRGLKRDGTVIEAEYGMSSGWAITQQALLWWLADMIKREMRDDTTWAQWLEAQEFGAMLTHEERERLSNAAKHVGASIGRGSSTLIEAFVKGIGGGLAKGLVG